MTIMKTPCRAACKNKGGICSGCHRTIEEVIQWQHFTDKERDSVMKRLAGESTTHVCPSCGEPAYCDINAGKETCWCFELEQRDTSSLNESHHCLCRRCLTALPIE